MIEIVEKTVEEVTTTLFQHLNVEMDKSGSHRKQEAEVVGLADVDDLLTLQVNRESISGDGINTVNLTMQRLPHQDSFNEMEFITPVIAGVEIAKEDSIADESMEVIIFAENEGLIAEAENKAVAVSYTHLTLPTILRV